MREVELSLPVSLVDELAEELPELMERSDYDPTSQNDIVICHFCGAQRSGGLGKLLAHEAGCLGVRLVQHIDLARQAAAQRRIEQLVRAAHVPLAKR